MANDEVSLSQGTVRYSDTGTGPTLVFVHGLLVNGTLWRKVVPLLESVGRAPGRHARRCTESGSRATERPCATACR